MLGAAAFPAEECINIELRHLTTGRDVCFMFNERAPRFRVIPEEPSIPVGTAVNQSRLSRHHAPPCFPLSTFIQCSHVHMSNVVDRASGSPLGQQTTNVVVHALSLELR